MMSAPCRRAKGRDRSCGASLASIFERVEIDEREADVLRERLHDDALGQRVALVAAPARGPSTRRPRPGARPRRRSRPRLRGPAERWRSRRACVTSPRRDGSRRCSFVMRPARSRTSHRYSKRERRAGVERRAGHESGAYHGWGRGRRRLRPAGAGVLRPRAPVAATRGPPAPWQARRPAAARYPGEPYVEPPHRS